MNIISNAILIVALTMALSTLLVARRACGSRNLPGLLAIAMLGGAVRLFLLIAFAAGCGFGWVAHAIATERAAELPAEAP